MVMQVAAGRPKLGVGVIVEDGEGRVLVGKRKGSHGAGQWSMPGGKPDDGESPAEAALRELFEETHLTVHTIDDCQIWGYDQFPEDDLHYVTVYFAVVSTDDPVLVEPDKCEGWVWRDPQELLDEYLTGRIELFPGTSEALTKWFDLGA